MSTEFWRWTRPRARKPARCHGCYRTIEAGEHYHKCEGLHDLPASPWRECLHCYDLVRLYNLDEWTDGERPGFEGTFQWEPEDIAALRHKVQWARKWTHSTGALYPIPTRKVTP